MENWGSLIHLFVTVFLSNFSQLIIDPAVPDVTLEALCPGEDECSAAIYITGVQQAISGIGSVIVMPLIGNLSDIYGRKTMLTIPLVLSIIPSVILAWKRTLNFLYAYYAIQTLTSMVTQNGVVCIALAYLADNVSEGKRISTFGILSGVIYAAYVGGTLSARLLSTTQIFQASAAASIVAAIYMIVFLKERTGETDPLERPILRVKESNEESCEASNKIDWIQNIPSPRDVFHLLKSSTTFQLAAFVAFFNSLAQAGLDACLLYFLKARFHFKKDRFADVLLISYVGATITNMIFMPTLGPLIGEHTLLSLGLFAGFLNMFLDSVAWASWVIYAAAALGIFLFLSLTNLRSIISKQVGPSEQGLAQGCILGITALAYFLSTLIFSPLSALVLAKDAPFHFQGFSVLCVGLAWLIGFFLSIMIPILSRKKSRNHIVVV